MCGVDALGHVNSTVATAVPLTAKRKAADSVLARRTQCAWHVLKALDSCGTRRCMGMLKVRVHTTCAGGKHRSPVSVQQCGYCDLLCELIQTHDGDDIGRYSRRSSSGCDCAAVLDSG